MEGYQTYMLLDNGNYLAISDKGIYKYGYESNTFKLIYPAQKECNTHKKQNK